MTDVMFILHLHTIFTDMSDLTHGETEIQLLPPPRSLSPVICKNKKKIQPLKKGRCFTEDLLYRSISSNPSFVCVNSNLR